MYTIRTTISFAGDLQQKVSTRFEGNLNGGWVEHVAAVEKSARIGTNEKAQEEKHPLTEVFDSCLADTLFVVNSHERYIDAEFARGMARTTSPTLEVSEGVVQCIASAVKRIKAEAFYPDAGTVIDTAILQATKGKGQRHGGDKTPFLEQPWVRLYKTHGLGFLLGQADKKYHEACGKENKEDAEREFLGAIVYLGMALLVLEGKVK